MKPRKARPEELRLWALVTSTVRPGPGRAAPEIPPEPEPAPPANANPPIGAKPLVPPPAQRKAKPLAPPPPGDIEPGRKRRLTRERDIIDFRLDLHGLDQDRARAALHAFLVRAQADGERAVLVITGKGLQGDGILRRRAPDWLAEPAMRGVVAGVSSAHRRHGGEGALYVALKRRI